MKFELLEDEVPHHGSRPRQRFCPAVPDFIVFRSFQTTGLEFGSLTNLTCGLGGPFLSPNLIRKIGFILE
jgi:hypothetical protein